MENKGNPMMLGIKWGFSFFAGLCCCASFARADAPVIKAFVSVLPQVYFVEQVGGDRVDVESLVEPGASPATYDPGPRQMAALSTADVFFRIGVPFENVFLPKLKEIVPDLYVVDTRQGVEMRRMKGHHHHDDVHDAVNEHSGGLDPHIWLDPVRVKIQARTIADALGRLDPSGADVYNGNCDAFIGKLDALNGWISQKLSPFAGDTLMVFHPSWGYFAERYGLEQEAIELEGKEPGARQLARLMERVREEGISVIFVQPQFSQASARAVAKAIGGKVLVLDPLAEDYISNLKTVTGRIREGLGSSE